MSDLKFALLYANYQKPDKVEAIENLEVEFKKLREYIAGYNQNNNLDYLINHLKYRFDEIEHQQKRIEVILQKLINKDFKGWTNSELDINQIEIDYYHEIVNLCDDAKANIIENIALHDVHFFDGEKRKFLDYLEPDHHLRRKRKELKPTLPAESKIIDEPVIKEIQSDKPKSDFKTKYWFKVGLLFATGEMAKLKIQFQSVSTQIAKHLGNEKGFRPYISASLSEATKKPISDKNIFSKPDKLLKIYKHCKENKIEMTETFIKVYNEQNPHE